MAVRNTGQIPHSQNFVGLSTDTKPNRGYIGDKFYEIDTGKEFIYDDVNWVKKINPIMVTAIFEGITTADGTTSQLIDNTKNIELNSLNGKTIKFDLGDTEYIRTITSSTGNTIGFSAGNNTDPVITGTRYIVF